MRSRWSLNDKRSQFSVFSSQLSTLNSQLKSFQFSVFSFQFIFVSLYRYEERKTDFFD